MKIGMVDKLSASTAGTHSAVCNRGKWRTVRDTAGAYHGGSCSEGLRSGFVGTRGAPVGTRG